MTTRRMLDAVTLRRVVAVLLIGGFAKEIVSFLTWLADTGWALWDVASVRALALASVRFALEVALIYLALRGLGSVLGRRHRDRYSLDAEDGTGDEPSRSGVLEAFESEGTETPGRSRKGGSDGDAPEHR